MPATQIGTRRRPTLRRTMETVHALLRGELSADEAARRLGASESRVRAYQDFVRGHVEDILEKNYPVLFAILPRTVRRKLTDRYFERYPARAYELNANAAPFRELLAELAARGVLGLTGFHVELAELEWQEWVVYSARDEIPPPEQLSRATLNPTLVALNFEYPVAQFVEAWREGRRAAPPEDRAPEHALVFREPLTDLVVSCPATEELLFALKMVHEGASPEEAAASAGLPVEIARGTLEQAAEIGLVLLPADDPFHTLDARRV